MLKVVIDLLVDDAEENPAEGCEDGAYGLYWHLGAYLEATRCVATWNHGRKRWP